jgi:hypothetical protein
MRRRYWLIDNTPEAKELAETYVQLRKELGYGRYND